MDVTEKQQILRPYALNWRENEMGIFSTKSEFMDKVKSRQKYPVCCKQKNFYFLFEVCGDERDKTKNTKWKSVAKIWAPFATKVGNVAANYMHDYTAKRIYQDSFQCPTSSSDTESIAPIVEVGGCACDEELSESEKNGSRLVICLNHRPFNCYSIIGEWIRSQSQLSIRILDKVLKSSTFSDKRTGFTTKIVQKSFIDNFDKKLGCERCTCFLVKKCQSRYCRFQESDESLCEKFLRGVESLRYLVSVRILVSSHTTAGFLLEIYKSFPKGESTLPTVVEANLVYVYDADLRDFFRAIVVTLDFSDVLYLDTEFKIPTALGKGKMVTSPKLKRKREHFDTIDSKHTTASKVDVKRQKTDADETVSDSIQTFNASFTAPPRLNKDEFHTSSSTSSITFPTHTHCIAAPSRLVRFDQLMYERLEGLYTSFSGDRYKSDILLCGNGGGTFESTDELKTPCFASVDTISRFFAHQCDSWMNLYQIQDEAKHALSLSHQFSLVNFTLSSIISVHLMSMLLSPLAKEPYTHTSSRAELESLSIDEHSGLQSICDLLKEEDQSTTSAMDINDWDNSSPELYVDSDEDLLGACENVEETECPPTATLSDYLDDTLKQKHVLLSRPLDSSPMEGQDALGFAFFLYAKHIINCSSVLEPFHFLITAHTSGDSFHVDKGLASFYFNGSESKLSQEDAERQSEKRTMVNSLFKRYVLGSVPKPLQKKVIKPIPPISFAFCGYFPVLLKNLKNEKIMEDVEFARTSISKFHKDTLSMNGSICALDVLAYMSRVVGVHRLPPLSTEDRIDWSKLRQSLIISRGVSERKAWGDHRGLGENELKEKRKGKWDRYLVNHLIAANLFKAKVANERNESGVEKDCRIAIHRPGDGECIFVGDVMILYTADSLHSAAFFLPHVAVSKLKLMYPSIFAKEDGKRANQRCPVYTPSFPRQSLPSKALKGFFDSDDGSRVKESECAAGFLSLDLKTGWSRTDCWWNYEDKHPDFERYLHRLQVQSAGMRSKRFEEDRECKGAKISSLKKIVINLGSLEEPNELSVGRFSGYGFSHEMIVEGTYGKKYCTHTLAPQSIFSSPCTPIPLPSDGREGGLLDNAILCRSGSRGMIKNLCFTGFDASKYTSNLSLFATKDTHTFASLIKRFRTFVEISGLSPCAGLLCIPLQWHTPLTTEDKRNLRYTTLLDKSLDDPMLWAQNRIDVLRRRDEMYHQRLRRFQNQLENSAFAASRQFIDFPDLFEETLRPSETFVTIDDEVFRTTTTLLQKSFAFPTESPVLAGYSQRPSTNMLKKLVKNRHSSLSETTGCDIEGMFLHFAGSNDFEAEMFGTKFGIEMFYPDVIREVLRVKDTANSTERLRVLDIVMEAVRLEQVFVRALLRELVGFKQTLESDANMPIDDPHTTRGDFLDEKEAFGDPLTSLSPVDMPAPVYFLCYFLARRLHDLVSMLSNLTRHRDRLKAGSIVCSDEVSASDLFENYQEGLLDLWRGLDRHITEYSTNETERDRQGKVQGFRKELSLTMRTYGHDSLLRSKNPSLQNSLVDGIDVCYQEDREGERVNILFTPFKKWHNSIYLTTKVYNLALMTYDKQDTETLAYQLSDHNFTPEYVDLHKRTLSKLVERDVLSTTPIFTHPSAKKGAHCPLRPDQEEVYYAPRFPAVCCENSFITRRGEPGNILFVSIPPEGASKSLKYSFFYDMCSWIELIYTSNIMKYIDQDEIHRSVAENRLIMTHPWLINSGIGVVRRGQEVVEEPGLTNSQDNPRQYRRGYSTQIPPLYFSDTSMVGCPYDPDSLKFFFIAPEDRKENIETGEDDYQFLGDMYRNILDTMTNTSFATFQDATGGFEQKDLTDKAYQPIVFTTTDNIDFEMNDIAEGGGVMMKVLNTFFDIYTDPDMDLCEKIESSIPASPGKTGGESQENTIEEYFIPSQIFAFHPEIEMGEKPEAEKHTILGNKRSVFFTERFCSLLESVRSGKILSSRTLMMPSQDRNPLQSKICDHTTLPFYLPKILAILLNFSNLVGAKLLQRFHPFLWGSGTFLSDSRRCMKTTLFDREQQKGGFQGLCSKVYTKSPRDVVSTLYNRNIFRLNCSEHVPENLLSEKKFEDGVDRLVYGSSYSRKKVIQIRRLNYSSSEELNAADFEDMDALLSLGESFQDLDKHSSPIRSFSDFCTAASLANMSKIKIEVLLNQTNTPYTEILNEEESDSLTIPRLLSIITVARHLHSWTEHWGTSFRRTMATIISKPGEIEQTFRVMGEFGVSQYLSQSYTSAKRTFVPKLIGKAEGGLTHFEEQQLNRFLAKMETKVIYRTTEFRKVSGEVYAQAPSLPLCTLRTLSPAIYLLLFSKKTTLMDESDDSLKKQGVAAMIEHNTAAYLQMKRIQLDGEKGKWVPYEKYRNTSFESQVKQKYRRETTVSLSLRHNFIPSVDCIVSESLRRTADVLGLEFEDGWANPMKCGEGAFLPRDPWLYCVLGCTLEAGYYSYFVSKWISLEAKSDNRILNTIVKAVTEHDIRQLSSDFTICFDFTEPHLYGPNIASIPDVMSCEIMSCMKYCRFLPVLRTFESGLDIVDGKVKMKQEYVQEIHDIVFRSMNFVFKTCRTSGMLDGFGNR